MQLILSLFQVWCILVIIMVCTDSKDFGKLFTIKYGTAMIAKVITMMFPIVTWFLDIGVFLGTNAKFEEGLDCPPSAIRLIGFVVTSVTLVRVPTI